MHCVRAILAYPNLRDIRLDDACVGYSEQVVATIVTLTSLAGLKIDDVLWGDRLMTTFAVDIWKLQEIECSWVDVSSCSVEGIRHLLSGICRGGQALTSVILQCCNSFRRQKYAELRGAFVEVGRLPKLRKFAFEDMRRAGHSFHSEQTVLKAEL